MTNRTLQRRTCLRAFAGLLAAAAGCRAAHAADPKKMIVLYFSWSGSTQKVAEEIQRLTGCDIARIETVTPYPRDYQATVKIAVPEHESKARPPIRPLPDLSAYNVIAIGHPIWSGQMPMALYTSLENTDLSGKTIFHFSTSGGSGLGNSQQEIARLEPNARLLPGHTVYGWGGVRDLSVVRGWLEADGIALKSGT